MPKAEKWTKEWWEEKWAKLSGAVVGAFVALLGLVLLWWFHDPGLGHGLGEALTIAGVLAIVVDPWLKSRFLGETLKDSFQHIFGYGLPDPYREKLRDFVNDPVWFRKDMVMECVFQEERDGKREIKIHLSWDLENQMLKPVTYHQHLDFESAEHPKLEKVSLAVNDKEVEAYGRDANLVPTDDGSLEYRHPGYVIQPNVKKINGKQIKYRFTADCIVSYPPTFFYAQHFSDPTLHFVLKVKKPISLNVVPRPAGLPSQVEGWECWTYDELFLKDDHIFIRWESAAAPKPWVY